MRRLRQYLAGAARLRARIPSISTAIVENNLRARPVGGLDPQLMPESSRPGNDQRETFRHCPECGSERFTQRRARG